MQATNRANTRAVELLQPQLALAEAKLQQADNSIEGARVGLAREQHREAVLAWFDYLKAGLPLLQAAEQFGAQGAVSMNRGQGMHLDANPSRWFFGSIRTTV